MNHSNAASLPTRPAGRPSRSYRLDMLWLALPAALFLLVFLAYPAIKVLALSLMQNNTGAFSTAAFDRFFGPSVYNRVLGNTFAIAWQTTAWCLLCGYPLAYWLSRLPVRRQQFLALLVLLAFWTSALVKNFSWLVLLSRTGFMATLMQALGLPGGDHLLFNRAVVIFAMTHTLLPLGVVTMLPVMNQVDRHCMSAAATLGADRAQMFWRVFFPLSMRGVASAGLLVFISSLGFFITPSFLGSPKEMMLGQLVILQINELQNWQMGAALAVVLVVTALVCCMVYDMVFGLSSIAGGDGQARSLRNRWLRGLGIALTSVLGTACSRLLRLVEKQPLRLPLLSLYGCALLVVLLFPIVAIVPMAFTDSTFLSFPPTGFSLCWFAAYFNSPLWMEATVRSFGIGLATALITSVLATSAALAVLRSNSRLRRPAFLLFLSPMMVPHIVIAIGMFYLCARFGLVATNTGIALGHIVIALPIMFVIMLGTFKGHDWGLDSAAATLGANRLQVLRRVTLPLVKAGLGAAFVIGFLTSFEELTVALFIGGGIKSTVPKQMWTDIVLQTTPLLAAASTVVLVVVTLLFLSAHYLRPRGGRT
jgi:putative spermidine/putrescine transport system permease protein